MNILGDMMGWITGYEQDMQGPKREGSIMQIMEGRLVITYLDIKLRTLPWL